jgi:hypothetical protein
MKIFDKQHELLLMNAIHGDTNSYKQYKLLTEQPHIMTVAGVRSKLDLDMFTFVFNELKKLTINQLNNCNAMLLYELAHIVMRPNIDDQIKSEFIRFTGELGKKNSLPCAKLYIYLRKPSQENIDLATKNVNRRTLSILSFYIPYYYLEWESYEDDVQLYNTVIENIINSYPDVSFKDIINFSLFQRTERQLTTDLDTLERQEHDIQQVKEIKALLLSFKKNLSQDDRKKILAYLEDATKKNIIKSQRNDYMAERYLGYFMLKFNQLNAKDDNISISNINNNCQRALLNLERAILAGDPYASLFLGQCKLKGSSPVRRDVISGFNLIRKAANWGLAEAQQTLGDYYYKHRRYQKASIWYQLAIDQGTKSLIEKLTICQQKNQAITKYTSIQNSELCDELSTRYAKKINTIFPIDFDWEGIAQETDTLICDTYPNKFEYSTIMQENNEPPKKKQKIDQSAVMYPTYYPNYTSLFKSNTSLDVDKICDDLDMNEKFSII